MLRSEVNQGIIDLFEDCSYLEIGVSLGVTFDKIIAHRKVAVDPAFAFDAGAAATMNYPAISTSPGMQRHKVSMSFSSMGCTNLIRFCAIF